jgi:diguanylate cyclase (GGDEF)-like protein
MMAALLATGLGSVALVGGVAYVSVNYKVDSLRQQQAAEHFHTYMTAYLAEYGDWSTAIATESFDRFVRRQEGERPSTGADGRPGAGELLSEMLARMPPRINEQARLAARMRADTGASAAPGAPAVPGGATQAESIGAAAANADAGVPASSSQQRDGYGPPPGGDGQRAPRSEYGPPPEGRDQRAPHDGFGPPPERDGQRPPRSENSASQHGERPAVQAAPASSPAPANAALSPSVRPIEATGPRASADRLPPPRHGDGPPPFRFILTDASYKVLLGGGRYGPNEMLPEALRASARPIVVKDKTVAYMSSEGTLAPTPQEQKYLDALYNSLLWGIAAAAGLATLLGVLLSRGLSRSLSGLTKAVKGMQKGELRQQVQVKGKDEVAALASAFNEMSEQLAQSHDELNTSHATILQQAEQLRELSIRDALTQLYNRRHFDEQANTLFNQAVRHKRPLALVICDIDHFKKINDTYSHATGDTVLRHVGSILRKHMRLSDLVARYGGEEFVMAFPETPGPQAAALCDKLRTLIEGFPWHEVHPELKVTMSMGVYADIAAGSAETMLQKADALLYRAKETGRNRVCFA